MENCKKQEVYLSAAYHNKQEFGRRLEATLAQLRQEELGNRVRWVGRDDDGDAVLRIADETAEQTTARIAAAQGLRLYRLPN